MKNIKIYKSAKVIFFTSFISATFLLIGFWMTRNLIFIYLGFAFFTFAKIINLLAIVAYIHDAVFDKSKMKINLSSALLLLFNVPVAFLYFYLFKKLSL